MRDYLNKIISASSYSPVAGSNSLEHEDTDQSSIVDERMSKVFYDVDRMKIDKNFDYLGKKTEK
jgi:hypothetical protein